MACRDTTARAIGARPLAPETGPMIKFLHVMIRVADLARSIDFYGSAFAMRESHRLAFPTFTLVYLRDAISGVELELTLNHGGKYDSEPYTHGTGYGHVAFAVDELDACHARLDALDLAPGPIKTLERDGRAAARFFFISDPDGYKIEVLASRGHYV
jgi:lactoylglutathione lyase